jgi:hypothetical protein
VSHANDVASAAPGAPQRLARWLDAHGATPRRHDLRIARPSGAVTEATVDTVFQAINAHYDDYHSDRKLLAQLTPGQRALYLLRVADDEINNGGYEQLLDNDGRVFAREAAAAAHLVGAPRLERLLVQALGGSDIDDAWFSFEDAQHGGVEVELAPYVRAHPEEFFRP